MTTLEDALHWLRDACGDLPEVTETITFSHPTWQANRKTFCVLEQITGVLFLTTIIARLAGIYLPAAGGHSE